MDSEALAALTKLFLCFPQATLGTELQAARLAAYCEVLSRAIPRHVVAACQMATEGKIGHPGFLPSAGELYQATQRMAADDAAQERLKRENEVIISRLKLQTPAEIPQTQRDKIAAGLKKLVAELAKGMTATK